MIRAALLLWVLALDAAAQEPTLEQWAKRHDLELVTDPSDSYPLKTEHGEISGRRAPAERVAAYAPLAARELAKYPAEFVKKLDLRKIVLARDLKFAGEKRAGIPDFENRALHLDPEEGRHSPVYQQTVIHHEIFHIVDWLDDGELYDDAGWKKLNPRDFRYGAGGKSARGSDQWPLDDSLAGFLNKYSMSGVEEDKAEIYSNLLVRASVVQRRAEKDEIVAKKLARMKELLEEFCPKLDARFWRTLRE